MRIDQAVRFVFNKAYRAAPFLVSLYLFLIVVTSIGSVFNILFLKLAIDSAANQKSFFDLSLLSVLILMTIFNIIYTSLQKLTEYIWNLIDLKQTVYSTVTFVDKLSTFDLSNFENPQSFDKIWRSFNRLAWQLKFYLDAAIKFLCSIIALSVSILIFFFASPLNALIIIVANIIPIIVRSKIGNQTFNIYKADSETRRRYEYTSGLVTNREMLTEIKQYQGFNFVKNRLLLIYDAFIKKQTKLFKKAWILLTLVEQLPILAVFFFLINMAFQLQSKGTTTGTFVFLFTNIFLFNNALGQLGIYLTTLISDSYFIHDAIDFYNIKPNIQFPILETKEEKRVLSTIKKPTIVIKNLSFHYPNSEKKVLTNINLTIPFGQNIALIGENGAGKTTLVKLLLRVYDPSEGRILINGIDLKTIPEQLLFKIYATLFQSFGKFYLTIRENMELASGKKLSDEEYIDSLKKSNAWNFIKNFPKQLDQQLGPTYTDGTDLSGGQWQQLAIGRALVRKTPVLILDEPTSSVDAKSETEIFDRLNRETKSSTVLFISHRFSTIKEAQRIIVLDKGKIVEDGDHESLLKNKAKYATLYTLQAERYIRE
ncbi:ABC transporter ATP-binding protein [Candidatus Roizmanbacteria bacterium]|nr:ABC transporter ATP-binding protein [Candidatus Roizmanbacteria bacterium]